MSAGGWRCWWGFHDWSPWEEVVADVQLYFAGQPTAIIQAPRQRHECTACRRVEIIPLGTP